MEPWGLGSREVLDLLLVYSSQEEDEGCSGFRENISGCVWLVLEIRVNFRAYFFFMPMPY